MRPRAFPKGCTITDIRRGTFDRKLYVYAVLRSPDGSVLIRATLDYITEQLLQADFLPLHPADVAAEKREADA